MNLNNNGTAIASAAYAYDGMSRLATVSDGANTAAYSRIPGSSLLNTTLLRQGSDGQAVLTVDRDYDNLNRLTSISSSVSIGVHPWLKSYSYEYNTLDKRIKTTLADGSYWEYAYDSLGQVVSAVKHTAAGTAIPGFSFAYDFDTIGNRKSVTTPPAPPSSHTSNNLNQYLSLIHI